MHFLLFNYGYYDMDETGTTAHSIHDLSARLDTSPVAMTHEELSTGEFSLSVARREPCVQLVVQVDVV